MNVLHPHVSMEGHVMMTLTATSAHVLTDTQECIVKPVWGHCDGYG